MRSRFFVEKTMWTKTWASDYDMALEGCALSGLLYL